MHKRELVDEVARRSGPWGLTRRQVREALHSILFVGDSDDGSGPARLETRNRPAGRFTRQSSP
jgi:hypothetical protein